MKKKILVCLLALLMIAPSFASCAQSNVSTDETTNSSSSQPQAEAAETEAEEAEITLESAAKGYADRNYEGYEYRIADRGSGDWKTFDVYAEEITGEVINDAVYNRNTTIEDTINIKIVEAPMDAVASTLKSSIMSSTDDYDIATDGLNSFANLITSNYLVDFRTIDSIKAENEWWDQQIYSELSILNKSYYMTGDISVMDNYGTWCYLFNKTMVQDFGLDNPYDLVDSGKWTIDKHNEMASAATLDVDGDGKWTMADYYGFITENYNTMALWTCFGNRVVTKDADDLPVYTYDGEEQITQLMKVVETQYSDFSNMGLKSTVQGGGSFQDNTRENQFAIGRALFYYAGMRNITLFRESETDFGIIPAPKYNEEQSQYYSSYSNGNLTVYAIPITVADKEKVGDITEIMAHLSVYTLTPAYMDQTLIGKSTRDVESEPMIKLILSTHNFDLGIVFDWGGVCSSIYNLSSPDVVASSFAKTKKAANKVLDKFINDIVSR